MRVATHTDVMDNPRYGMRELNPGPPFFVVIKNFSAYCFCASAKGSATKPESHTLCD